MDKETSKHTSKHTSNGWTPRYVRAWIFYIAMAGLVVAGLTLFGMGLLGVNLLERVLGQGAVIVYLLIGACTLYLMFDRDTYLPFLGPTHSPCGALEPRTPVGASQEVVLQITPHTKVLYWASEPATEGLKNIPSWKGAYLGYDNTGVAVSDDVGRVVLRVRPPQPYRVPLYGLLEPHVHYRICEESGWMGRVMTVPIQGAPTVEPFSGQDAEHMATWI